MAAPDGGLSEVTVLNFRGNWWIDRAAIVARKDARKDESRPTILAIIGDGRPDLEALNWVRSWLADARGWQVLVPLKERCAEEVKQAGFLAELADLITADDYTDSTEVSPRVMAAMLQSLLQEARDAASPLPSRIEGGRVHLIGLASGSSTALALARRAPHLLASFTCFSGRISADCDLSPLRIIPLLRLYVGECEPTEHRRGYEAVAKTIQAHGENASPLRVLPAAPSVLFNEHFDFGVLWADLEGARAALGARGPLRSERLQGEGQDPRLRKAETRKAWLTESLPFDERFNGVSSNAYFTKVRARCPDADELTTASDDSFEPGCHAEECATWGPCSGGTWR